MSKYTTGEMARLCGISVRTVQYYDNRSILIPSELSEGGRRLYTEDDLKKLRIICFLRSIDLPINTIARILEDESSAEVVGLLLKEQSDVLRAEIDQKQRQLQALQTITGELKNLHHFTMESIGDIAYIMENKKKLRRARAVLLTVGILMDVIQVATILLWIFKGIWLPFAIGMPLVIGMGVWISAYYFRRTAYICPKCHQVFQPRFYQALFAPHTSNTRKLTCTACGHRGFCVETYNKAAKTGQ